MNEKDKNNNPIITDEDINSAPSETIESFQEKQVCSPEFKDGCQDVES